jgi:hypothetical protein
VQNEAIQVPISTPIQMPRESTPGPSPADTYERSPNEFTPELSPDHNFDPVDTYERCPDEFTPEISPNHDSDRVHTPAQSPDEITHASSPPAQPGQDQTFETHCDISSSRSLKPMVTKLERKNSILKEKLHEYILFRCQENPLPDLVQLTPMNEAQMSSPLNSIQTIILIQLTLMSAAQMSLLLNSVQIMIPLEFTPLLKAQTSLPMRLALQHSQDKTKRLKPTTRFPPVGP